MAEPKTREPQLSDFPSRTYDKLRYGDTDRQGHINNAVFATLFETGRVDMLLGSGQGGLIAAGRSLVIVRLVIEFRAEILWPGVVEIGSRIAHIGTSSVRIAQAAFQDGRLVATGESVVVQVDNGTRKACPLGAETLARLQPLMGDGRAAATG